MSKPAPSAGDLLTTAQVAELTPWSVTSINRWAQKGILPAIKLPGRTGAYLFNRADIETFRPPSEVAAA